MQIEFFWMQRAFECESITLKTVINQNIAICIELILWQIFSNNLQQKIANFMLHCSSMLCE